MNRFVGASYTGRSAAVHWLALGVIAALACGLYLPFRENPLVFDDKIFFRGEHFAYFATHPLGLAIRLPAYFSIALTQVLSGRLDVHRVISLTLHVLTACALYWFIVEMLRDARRARGGETSPSETRKTATAALFAAGGFAIHPAAVYGAAYLVQRSIVLAALFSVLCLLAWRRALVTERTAYVIAAAIFYSLAVLSKEHAVLLAVAALPLALTVDVERRAARRNAIAFLVACAPAGLLVLAMSAKLLGTGYEPHFRAIETQMENLSGQGATSLTWPLSVVTQMGLFFRYLAAWLWPRTGAMAIDVRVDLFATWTLPWIVAKVAAFSGFGLLTFVLLRRGGRQAMIGYGLLYAWISFVVEFSTLRFQEPYVLYRSYLWAPGLAIAVAAAISAMGPRIQMALTAVAFSVLLFQAHDRLSTFQSPLRLWEDAAQKLPDRPVPWGSRVLYNLGREYLYSGRPQEAMATAERCMALYPSTLECVYARGAIYFRTGEYEQALTEFERAAAMEPRNGEVQFRIGQVLEEQGRITEAAERYRAAAALGFGAGTVELRRLMGEPAGRNKETAEPGARVR